MHVSSRLTPAGNLASSCISSGLARDAVHIPQVPACATESEMTGEKMDACHDAHVAGFWASLSALSGSPDTLITTGSSKAPSGSRKTPASPSKKVESILLETLAWNATGFTRQIGFAQASAQDWSTHCSCPAAQPGEQLTPNGLQLPSGHMIGVEPAHPSYGLQNPIAMHWPSAQRSRPGAHPKSFGQKMLAERQLPSWHRNGACSGQLGTVMHASRDCAQLPS
mmetsp:Transcript_50948/g.108883  ORF Transcript_50948/g.108883 Transcript_50948/m.108883 type:complete len:224 (-) Transcript_50948:313-984(-)